MILQIGLTWIVTAVGVSLISIRSITSKLEIIILYSGDSSLVISFIKKSSIVIS